MRQDHHRANPHRLLIGCGIWMSATASWCCSCVIFDADYILKSSDLVFVGEVTNVGASHKATLPYVNFEADVTPFTYRIVESLKTTSSAPPMLRAEGRPSSCEIQPIVGTKYLFTISKNQEIVGMCQMSHIVNDQLQALRAASHVSK
jgi:hypothetical protein